ncbi:short chain dehydrogenase [Pseudooceanicola batsensis HTCC2597]|uniref:Short chain dehydrogenase n=1 Tax=Pseudooceanicola batsensis (strain ATCC BAA-863 / DSM 15984 / KCTC 12145 / HTCC2597) TaxID=252305 RepID=A3TU11_PSEBH|nr:SDR family oxidoreductase [Pseudooceanicola batsensis]EAQ05138.1 short chain dehydrogenase [Pseudooceanicola batsensis HTCC2597]
MPRALVTGAAKRIGRAIAIELAEQGYDVAVHYGGSEAEAQEVVARIRDMGREAHAVQADLAREAEVQELVPAASAALGGPLTCLVNNASVFEHDTVETATRDSWDRHVECNLRAPFVLTQSFAAQCPRARADTSGEAVAQGCVVNLVDQRVRKLTPEFMTYTLTRAALWTLTQTTAQALAPHVRVNAIGPGPTLQAESQDDDQFARQRAATVLERGSSPEDICQALRYILNARALTGQLLCIDGGQHLGWQTPDVMGVE